MKTKLENLLFSKYPLFFKHYLLPSDQEKIDCPNGWYKLIKNVAATAELYNTTHVKHVHVKYIGEKFGLLCIHTDKEIEPISNIISQVYFQSFSICEYCGNSAKRILSGSWIKSICTKCLLKGKNKIKR